MFIITISCLAIQPFVNVLTARVRRQVVGHVQNVGFVAGFHYFGLMHVLNLKKGLPLLELLLVDTFSLVGEC
jgi:hypothetical protein